MLGLVKTAADACTHFDSLGEFADHVAVHDAHGGIGCNHAASVHPPLR